jgi:hypothetical protein
MLWPGLNPELQVFRHMDLISIHMNVNEDQLLRYISYCCGILILIAGCIFRRMCAYVKLMDAIFGRCSSGEKGERVRTA